MPILPYYIVWQEKIWNVPVDNMSNTVIQIYQGPTASSHILQLQAFCFTAFFSTAFTAVVTVLSTREVRSHLLSCWERTDRKQLTDRWQKQQYQMTAHLKHRICDFYHIDIPSIYRWMYEQEVQSSTHSCMMKLHVPTVYMPQFVLYKSNWSILYYKVEKYAISTDTVILMDFVVWSFTGFHCDCVPLESAWVPSDHGPVDGSFENHVV